eukprot:3109414-Pleurochrysis_carterae.AAC.3
MQSVVWICQKHVLIEEGLDPGNQTYTTIPTTTMALHPAFWRCYGRFSSEEKTKTGLTLTRSLVWWGASAHGIWIAETIGSSLPQVACLPA